MANIVEEHYSEELRRAKVKELIYLDGPEWAGYASSKSANTRERRKGWQLDKNRTRYVAFNPEPYCERLDIFLTAHYCLPVRLIQREISMYALRFPHVCTLCVSRSEEY